MEKILAYTYFYSEVFNMWGIFDERRKTISHYEETEFKAMRCCTKFNSEARKGLR